MHDVIIVGAGVAGCYLARKLHDLDVLVIERDPTIRLKDSGIVSRHFTKFVKKKSLLKDKIKEMDIVSASGANLEIRGKTPFAYILHRERFSEFLRNRVKDRIQYEYIQKIKRENDCISVTTKDGTHMCKMIVGCDGTNSIVRKFGGIKEPAISVGVMVKGANIPHSRITVFFNKYFSPDFFSWTIPQNTEYGMITKIRPREYLNFFRQSLQLGEGTIHSFTIPLGATKSFGNRLLLVGDACGQNKPITGGGIVFSMRCATYAADIIREAVETETYRDVFLSRYEQLWRKDIGQELKAQFFFRKIYRNMSNEQIDELFNVIRPIFSQPRDFDYDFLSNVISEIPKTTLIKFLIKHGKLLF